MQNYAAVFRTGDVLKEGVLKIDETYQEMADLRVKLCFSVLYYHGVYPAGIYLIEVNNGNPEQCEICS